MLWAESPFKLKRTPLYRDDRGVQTKNKSFAKKRVFHDEPSLDKPRFEVAVGKLIDFSVSNVKSEKSDIAEIVHPDLKGIDFNGPMFRTVSFYLLQLFNGITLNHKQINCALNY